MDIRTLLCLFVICAVESERRFTLKQVVILSRHGLRTPLSNVLNNMTPKTWPSWKEKPGYLTAKGRVLEGYMGKFFSDWLSNEELLPKSCPTEEYFYVYANTKQRTRASASSFVSEAFPDCNITIHKSNTDVDPIFNPVIHNTSAIFKEIVTEDMRMCLKMLSLNSSYEEVSEILDYRNSKLCLQEHKCNLTIDKNKVLVQAGQKPNLAGPLKISNSVIDAFIMQYYEGFAFKDVAWGNLKNDKDWRTLIKLSRSYHNIIFNTNQVAKDIAEPLLSFMSTFFFNNSFPKVVLLMGHDANLYTVLKSLDVKQYSLKNQYEMAPVSGKIVFQRWFDATKKHNFLRIDYVYQSYIQLRDSVVLSLDNPPQFELLELNNCEVDDNGFCSWKIFENIMKNFK